LSEKYAPKAVKAGCTVIDNSSAFRYDDDVPLIVPEVNGDLLGAVKKPLIIANPNCSTVQMVMVLKPIDDAVGIEKVNVATYQSVSGAGKEALEELVKETSYLLNGRSYDRKVFTKQIAFNCIPHIDRFEENGYTREEMKLVWETQKILGRSDLNVNPTAVRVPVFYGHAEAVHLELKKPLTVAKAEKLLKAMPGVSVMNARKDGTYPTQVGDASGNDNVFVGRIRKDISSKKGLNLWIVSDNLRKGAALNALQILDGLVE